jgi:hypothetical protein
MRLVRRSRRGETRFEALSVVAESVWARMRRIARTYASRGRALSIADARMLVLQMCRDENVQRPRPDALERLASELVRLTLEARQSVTYGVT